MHVDIRLEKAYPEELAAHAEISIAFRVEEILVPNPGDGPFHFTAQRLSAPRIKDYDAEEGGDPALWARRFDTSGWRVLSAWRRSRRVGGLVLFANVPGVELLEGRSDLALIWDLRVAPDARGLGIGVRLVAAAEEWARAEGCSELKVETQNTNVGAVRFYESLGFTLREVRRGAYARLPDELQMLFYRTIR